MPVVCCLLQPLNNTGSRNENLTCDRLLRAGRQRVFKADMPSITMRQTVPSQNGTKSKQLGISGSATWIMAVSPQCWPAASPCSSWGWYMCKDQVAWRTRRGNDGVKEWLQLQPDAKCMVNTPRSGVCQSRSDHSCGLTQYKNTHTWPWQEKWKQHPHNCSLWLTWWVNLWKLISLHFWISSYEARRHFRQQ